ncbi:MAG TPA: galactokinase [Longilinea sp.]|nr:galactokinase [Longilinea sp.]
MNIEKLHENLPSAMFLSTAPGRVNLLGEHVDYNGGMVLPVAIDRAVRIAAEPVSGNHITITALDLGEKVEFTPSDLDSRMDIHGNTLPPWAHYPAGVAWVLKHRGLKVGGMRAVFTSDVPIGAGLSSSAAVEVAFAALWQAISGWEMDRMKLALACQEAENRYVGVNCGIMDQFASANGVEDHALYFDTRSLEWRPVPLPPNTVIVIADSGVRRSLTTSAYNDRRKACEEALAILKRDLPKIHDLRDVKPDVFKQLEHRLPEVTRKRARHVVSECARMEKVTGVLQRGDAKTFGKLMLECHASLRDDYEVSCKELNILVELAYGLPGCYGARLTGAGFGGCTVNLVKTDQAEVFIKRLKEGYRLATNRQADVYLCHASQGAAVTNL